MLITKTFYVSISKKHTQTEVFGFEFKTEFNSSVDVDDINTRYQASSRAWDSPLIPAEFNDPYLYWISSVCID